MAQKRFRYRLQQILELKIQAEEDEKENGIRKIYLY